MPGLYVQLGCISTCQAGVEGGGHEAHGAHPPHRFDFWCDGLKQCGGPHGLKCGGPYGLKWEVGSMDLWSYRLANAADLLRFWWRSWLKDGSGKQIIIELLEFHYVCHFVHFVVHCLFRLIWYILVGAKLFSMSTVQPWSLRCCDWHWHLLTALAHFSAEYLVEQQVKIFIK